MLKKIKWLPLLFVLLSTFLVGCGDSLPYKEGEKYKEEGYSTYVEILNKNEWKVHKGKENEYDVYSIESTEYSNGEYMVVKISRKDSINGIDPWNVQRPKYQLMVKSEKGFNMLFLGRENEDPKWDKFQKEYKQATDKKDFLKKKIDSSGTKIDKLIKL
ncbi:DUF5512 family protein [Bacillus paramycoides]|uniref:DUF5512 family protein n=1 Tax=Bacillus paramycoides TaxID=2026194 RepID=UPI0015BA9B2E|nr:DUF5512 family protein [Bacillus paramycoides]NWK72630.1 DUF5512 family protein [Bacillus paramycoides]